MEYLNLVLNLVAGLVGFPALLAALINVAKSIGLLKDGQATNVNMVANLIAYVGVGLAVYFGKVDLLSGVDVQLGAFAQLLLAVLAFLNSIGATRQFHFRFAGLPVVGKSFSEEKYALPQG